MDVSEKKLGARRRTRALPFLTTMLLLPMVLLPAQTSFADTRTGRSVSAQLQATLTVVSTCTVAMGARGFQSTCNGGAAPEATYSHRRSFEDESSSQAPVEETRETVLAVRTVRAPNGAQISAGSVGREQGESEGYTLVTLYF